MTGNMRARAAAVALATCAIAAASAPGACKSGADDHASAGAHVMKDGEMIGRIERLAGGTAMATNPRTLLDAVCNDRTLTITTNRETVTARMDCSHMFLAPVVEKYIGRPVAISYSGKTHSLRVEGETADTVGMVFPVSKPRVTPNDAPP